MLGDGTDCGDGDDVDESGDMSCAFWQCFSSLSMSLTHLLHFSNDILFSHEKLY